MVQVPLIGADIAQLVEHSTEKAGAILMRVQVPSAARDFSPGVDFGCRLSYSVRTAPHVQSHALS